LVATRDYSSIPGRQPLFARNACGSDISRISRTALMCVVHERGDLLDVRVLVRDHVHEAFFGIRIHPLGAAQRLEADLQSRDWTADADRLAAADSDGDGQRARLRIQPHQLTQCGLDARTDARQNGHATLRADIELRPHAIDARKPRVIRITHDHRMCHATMPST
jgi:hypothetical protein